MELINATDMIAGYTLGIDRDGRESIVVAVKGTFSIPEDGGEPRLCPRQEPLIEADTFSGDPGFSAPLYESDYAPVKRRCDVLLHGKAHAPGGRPTKQVPVMLRIGSFSKSFNVVGNRIWLKMMGKGVPSEAHPFTEMPISYNHAFGGVDRSDPDPTNHVAFMKNPVGVGYHTHPAADRYEGEPLPTTEALGEHVELPNGDYSPMSFGVLGRGWLPRRTFAGTYDQNWIDNVFPFLPADFDDAYFQCAPRDQQIPHLQGGEPVELVNLSRKGRLLFRIPYREVPVLFFDREGGKVEGKAVADTLVLEPEMGRFMITWRAGIGLKKNIFEIPQAVVGVMPRMWWRARAAGKTYCASLTDAIKQRREMTEPTT